MKKFWRSGMIDKKVIRAREQEEYINRLHMGIIELRKESIKPKPCQCVYQDNNGKYVYYQSDDYDEIKKGDNAILDFNKSKNTNDKSLTFEEMLDFYIKHNKNRPQYDGYIGVENNKLLEDK